MAAYDIAIFPQFFRNFPQFSAIFPQFFRNFSQLDSTPLDRNFSPPLPRATAFPPPEVDRDQTSQTKNTVLDTGWVTCR